MRKQRISPTAVAESLADFLEEVTVKKWEKGPPPEQVNLERYRGEIRQWNADGSPKMGEDGKQIIVCTPETRALGALAFFKEVTHFEPRPYQIDIVFRLYENRRLSVRTPRGAGKCLAFGEMMQLADGSLVKCEDLIGKLFAVNSVMKDGWVEPRNAFATDNGVQPVYEIVTDKGRIIRRTVEHPLWSDVHPYRWDPKRHAEGLNPHGSWNQVSELKPGSLVAVSSENFGEGAPEIPDAWIKVAAYLIGDGCVTEAKGSVSFSQEPGPALDEFCSSIEELGCRIRHERKLCATVVSGEDCERGQWGMPVNAVKELCRRDGLWGKDSYTKRFPDWVWRLDDRQLSLFVSRLFACDGWAYSGTEKSGKPRKEIGFCTVGEGLARDLHRALLRLGFQFSLTKKKTSWTHKGVKKSGFAYTLSLRDAYSVRLFAEKVGIYGKEEALARLISACPASDGSMTQQWRRKGVPEGMAWERVREIRLAGEEPTVCITVPGPENFLTDFIEHNSACAANLILHFVAVNDVCKCVTTASSWAQLENFLWPEVHLWHSQADWELIGRRPKMNLLDFSFGGDDDAGIKPTAVAFAIRSDEPEKMEGAHSRKVLIVCDEAKEIEDPTFDALEGTLNKGDKYALVISTPGPPVGRFFDIQTQKPGYEDWDVRHVTKEEILAALEVEDVRNGTDEAETYRKWIEQRRKQWGSTNPMYLNHVEGHFADTSDTAMIPLEWIVAANERWERWKAAGFPEEMCGETPPHVLGVDMAGQGKDRTAIGKRIGKGLRDIECQPRDTDTVAAVKRILALTQSHGMGRFSQINIEADGVGLGPYEQMKDLRLKDQASYNHVRIVPIVSGSGTESRDLTGEYGFKNKRSWMWWRMRELLDPSNGHDIMLPPDSEFVNRGEKTTLTQELSLPTYKTVGDKIQVEAKDEIRKRLKGRSTDLADSAILAFADDSVPVVVETIKVTVEDTEDPNYTFYDAGDRWAGIYGRLRGW